MQMQSITPLNPTAALQLLQGKPAKQNPQRKQGTRLPFENEEGSTPPIEQDF